MNKRVLACIYAAIDEANLDREGAPPLEKSPSTPIHGENGLDSLGLINFVVAVEENLEREFEAMVVIGDDRALDRDPSPFGTVGALATYVEILLKEQGAA